jgi:membrane-bound inhibitor of C-type lysozyme
MKGPAQRHHGERRKRCQHGEFPRTCVQQSATASWQPIPRPSPEDNVPQGIAYACEGNKEVAVVYAKNRATVTFGAKTWRTEYQAASDGFRYSDSTVQWVGRDDLATLRENGGTNRPLAYNCRPTRRTT